MKVRLPYVIQDRRVADAKAFNPVEAFDWRPDPELSTDQNWDSVDQPEVFLDGPISTRVAVLDFNETTGALEPAVVLNTSGQRAEYQVAINLDDRAFQAVSSFSTVMKTLQTFESADVLGRRIEWASPGNQLLLIPRAGEWANAYYERESASLQFFSFKDPQGQVIHSSLSFDIVAHETGHAILDAIAPSLYDTITPESLALHEAIADITALVMSVTSSKLRETLLRQTDNSISGMNAFTWIAEEFGKARGGINGDPYLRNLSNKLTMGEVNSAEPHDLSQVLSGALFELLSWIFENRKRQAKSGEIPPETSGKSLVVANFIFRRVAFRALDYLPPGEIAFSDYGRALWAADRNSNPDSPEFREFFAEEFVRRGIIQSVTELDTAIENADIFTGVDLDGLTESDWLAYDFANRHRDLLRVPTNASRFSVLDRLQVSKVTYRLATGKVRYQELLFKISWEATEDNPVPGLPPRRGVSFGTTLAIDRSSGRIAGLVTTNPGVTAVDQSVERTTRLATLLDNDELGGSASGNASVITSAGVMRVTGGGRSLHMASRQGFRLAPAEQE